MRRIALFSFFTAVIFAGQAQATVEVRAGVTCDAPITDVSFSDPVHVAYSGPGASASATAIPLGGLRAEAAADSSGLSCKGGSYARDLENFRVFGLAPGQILALNATALFSSAVEAFATSSFPISGGGTSAVLEANLVQDRAADSIEIANDVVTKQHSRQFVSVTFLSDGYGYIDLGFSTLAYGSTGDGGSASISSLFPNSPVFIYASDSDTTDLSNLTLQIGDRAAEPLLRRSQIAGLAPEPTSWALMLGGFAIVGFSMRRQKRGTCLAPNLPHSAAVTAS